MLDAAVKDKALGVLYKEYNERYVFVRLVCFVSEIFMVIYTQTEQSSSASGLSENLKIHSGPILLRTISFYLQEENMVYLVSQCGRHFQVGSNCMAGTVGTLNWPCSVMYNRRTVMWCLGHRTTPGRES